VRGVGIGVQPVDCLGGDLAGSVETDGFIRAGDVVFAGLWNGDYIQPSLAEVISRGLALVVADDD